MYSISLSLFFVSSSQCWTNEWIESIVVRWWYEEYCSTTTNNIWGLWGWKKQDELVFCVCVSSAEVVWREIGILVPGIFTIFYWLLCLLVFVLVVHSLNQRSRKYLKSTRTVENIWTKMTVPKWLIHHLIRCDLLCHFTFLSSSLPASFLSPRSASWSISPGLILFWEE